MSAELLKVDDDALENYGKIQALLKFCKEVWLCQKKVF